MTLLDLLFTLLLAAGAAAGVPLASPGRPPRSTVSRREERRGEADLPFLLERIAAALSAGSSLQQALAQCLQSPGAKAGRLFAPVLDRVQAGVSLEDSLRQEGMRFQGRSIPLAFMTMAASLRTGANLVEALHALARVARDRQTLRKKVDALTAQGRLQGIILVFTPVFFLMALALVSPGSLRPILGTSLGRALLCAALLLDLVGALVIRRMVGRQVY